jgi:O-6-methylguanine DNA methyltransferase
VERKIDFIRMDSPIGQLLLADSGAGLCSVIFPTGSGGPDNLTLRARLKKRFGIFSLTENSDKFKEALSCLEHYFSAPADSEPYPGKLDSGGTEFQQRVWERLIRIPPGEAAAYGEVARSLGLPRASRAVGAACGANPLPIIIPCHRVIGKSGRLTGFGGGLELKARLLQAEGWVARD